MNYNADLQEVLEHTQRAPVATLYSTASKDFGQARQILETMQVGQVLVFQAKFCLLPDTTTTLNDPGHRTWRRSGHLDHDQQDQLRGRLRVGARLEAQHRLRLLSAPELPHRQAGVVGAGSNTFSTVPVVQVNDHL